MWCLRWPPELTQHSKMTAAVAAILLAAGQSQRMGAFKPLLPFGETTVIRSCLSNLHAAGVTNVVVVLGHRADEVQESLKDLTYVRFAFNRDPESEMSTSIARGIEALPRAAKAVLIALTDQPAIPPAAIKSIIDAWLAGDRLVIPQFNERGGHPVLIDLSFRTQLLRIDPQRGLRGFFADQHSEVRRLIVNSPYIARDLDTWDDYRALYEELFGSLPRSLFPENL
jgi:molybdenum cofactor cytidylyltransferase